MADISKCKGTDNILCKTCYRRTANEDPYWQAWMPPPIQDDGTCDFYWCEVDESTITVEELLDSKDFGKFRYDIRKLYKGK